MQLVRGGFKNEENNRLFLILYHVGQIELHFLEQSKREEKRQ